jgi:hypothetical protein
MRRIRNDVDQKSRTIKVMGYVIVLFMLSTGCLAAQLTAEVLGHELTRLDILISDRGIPVDQSLKEAKLINHLKNQQNISISALQLLTALVIFQADALLVCIDVLALS